MSELVSWQALINRESFLRMLDVMIDASDSPEMWKPFRRVIEREQGRAGPFRVEIVVEDWPYG